MSTITCNEEIKCNAKCKNSRFEPPFGDLGVRRANFREGGCPPTTFDVKRDRGMM